jgi:hypothetical protein
VQLTFLDWAVVALYFLFNIAIGYCYKARAGKNVSEFFLSGRNVPWWLAGTSMVACCCRAGTGASTPGARLGCTGRVRSRGMPWPREEIGSVRCEPNHEIQAGGVGEGPEIAVARKERNPAIDTALGDQDIVEARLWRLANTCS